MRKIIYYTIMVIVGLFIVEQVLTLPYILKTAIKLPLFTIYPLYMMKGIKLHGDFKKPMIVAMMVFAIIIIAYLVLGVFIDVEAIRYDMSHRMNITKSMFVIAAIYTVFINAFIEEVFFRGFIFKGLLNHSRKLSYIISALSFAIYHIAIFMTWFNIALTSLILLGLFVGGLIFNYFVEDTDSILSSYMIHIAADLAIVLIGIQVLGFA